MFAQLMPPLYVATLYAVSRYASLRGGENQAVVIDALALNWLISTLASMLLDVAIRDDFAAYQSKVVAYMGFDMCSALWLSLKVKGRVSGIAETFYLALIIFNAAFFFRSVFNPWTHWVGLSMISWGQLLAVVGGIMRDDLAEVAGRISTIVRVRVRLALGKKEAGG